MSTTTFTPNLRLPVHRWFRYPAGYSGAWAADVLGSLPPGRVHDPFAGVGTTLIAAQISGHQASGSEMHPLVEELARAKLDWSSDVQAFETRAASLLEGLAGHEWEGPPKLLSECYAPETLAQIRELRERLTLARDGSPAQRLCFLAFVAVLRRCASAGGSAWQYQQTGKARRAADLSAAYRAQVQMMSADMRRLQSQVPSPPSATLTRADARHNPAIETGSVDTVLTSPPYPNNYDYADGTRLELTVLGEAASWKDLSGVREALMHSCTQQITPRTVSPSLDDPLLAAIAAPLTAVYEQLEAVKMQRGGRKAYDRMILHYMHDMSRVLAEMRRVTRSGGLIGMVIGDSAPYGVHVPVPEWFMALAEANGLSPLGFVQRRERNVKWKNRKHRHPLCEGELWLGA